ncbi:MAG TPA: glycerol-3-phosphate 1-O-acyltransferase PlsY [Candidatus Limnocylindria bacterium]|nr:glycerol-3-phosphate 1-O-acyltransferase PlsY [Candidatus Limnocylindria bacterium]
MTGAFGAIVLVLIGYLLGAVPFGLIIGRLAGGVDLRRYGSGRTGATNALRTIGVRGAALVFLLDFAKGLVAVLLVRWLWGGDLGLTEWLAAAAGFAAILGHIWSLFIRFTGGRGVATSTGALAAMAPWSLVVLAPLVVVVIWRWRYVSLGSVSGALLAPIVVALLYVAGLASAAAIVYALAAGLLVTFAHADNIARLRAGTERKLGQKAVATDA